MSLFGALGTCVGEGNGTPLQYSCLENPIDGAAWWAAVQGVVTSRAQLSNFTFTFHFHVLEKEVAAHSSALDWRIPGMAEPDGLPPVGSHRVGHDRCDLAAAAAAGTCVPSPPCLHASGPCTHLHFIQVHWLFSFQPSCFKRFPLLRKHTSSLIFLLN